MKKTLSICLMLLMAGVFEIYALTNNKNTPPIEEIKNRLVENNLNSGLFSSETYMKDLFLNFTSKKHNYDLNAVTKSILQEDLFYTSNKLNVGKVYPSPAIRNAYIEYNMLENLKAKITIKNLLGKIVREYDLNKNKSKSNQKIHIPVSNLDSGVYFYTLSINGKAKKLSKFIINTK